ncbi:circadian clock KaiB family protein [Moorena sp. SIO3H5]|uniref:circadian clock KaiB family protein n=1 Tax=Moorena sp. SIO3H5 TaxID=2607834 RepID=UPI0013BCB763|nr:circadian clock KaiB family protein [Moorena sp. SIO3H5]NEO70158.1 circadian clock protein KaiB [Moorena sp. SIO3H5]
MLDETPLPQLFKGIAIFTPGEDLVYSIDFNKQSHWHLHLCASLQEILGLPEPPHFLVPGYTATIDRWIDPQTNQLRMSAEIHWLVQHHQALLNAVFGTENLMWQVAPWEEESCDPAVLETYRNQFPQLWQNHDLILRIDRPEPLSYSDTEEVLPERVTNQNSGRSSPQEHLRAMEKLPGLSKSATDSTDSLTATDVSKPDSLSRMSLPDVSHSQVQPTHSYVLRLFVSGHSTETEYTLKSLYQLLENHLGHPYTLKIIDVFKHPELAETDHISATPTLLRVWPEPVRRIVGDLNDIDQVLQRLTSNIVDSSALQQ